MRALALLVALVSCVSSAALAQTPPPARAPVTVTDCRPINGNAGFSLIAPPGTAVLNMSYRNDSAQALTEVHVALVVDGATVFTFDDVGTFAPGTTVRRRPQLKTDLFPLRAPASCEIVSVKFADGTAWTNPAVAPTTGAALEQTPQSRIGIERCQPEITDPTPSRTITSKKGDKTTTTTIRGSESTHYMNITFVDQAPVAATAVAFSLVADGKRLQRFEKQGTFSPAVPIAATFGADANIFPIPSMHPQCRVDEVQFADGTTWKNPAVPALAFGTAQTPGSHVDVTRCSTVPPGHENRSYQPGEVYVDYRNTAAIAATAVDFAIVVNGVAVTVSRAVGTFDPGADIRKSFRLSRAVVPLGTALPDCIVQRVEYADATAWTNPAPPSR
jgi:hypothetical protein